MSYKIIKDWLLDIDMVDIVARLAEAGVRLHNEKVSVKMLTKDLKTAFEEVFILENEFEHPFIECFMSGSQLIIIIESINYEQIFNTHENY